MFSNPFPANIGFGQVAIDSVSPTRLTAEERACLSQRASQKRILDFTAGREAARMAVHNCNGPATCSIPVGQSRMPDFPAGFIGSISHSGNLAVACAAREAATTAIGIDLEEFDPALDCRISDRVAGGTERSWLQQNPEQLRNNIILLFSAKESIYKAFFPLVQTYFGYQSVVLEHDSDLQEFRVASVAAALENHIPIGFRIRYCRAGNYVLSCCLM